VLHSFLFFFNMLNLDILGKPILDVFLAELEGVTLAMLEVQGVEGDVAGVYCAGGCL
jgi:hypothetical protein